MFPSTRCVVFWTFLQWQLASCGRPAPKPPRDRTFCAGLAMAVVSLGLVFATAGPLRADAVFQFELIYDSGFLEGQTFLGEARYDRSALTGIGREILLPRGADTSSSPIRVDGDLRLSVVVDDYEFTEMDDTRFPDQPQLYFRDGVLFGIAFLDGEEGPGNPLLQFARWREGFEDGPGEINQTTFRISEDMESQGTVRLIPIPEPSSLSALLSFAAIALMGRARRTPHEAHGRGSSDS